jgi:hypothetical protein
MIAILAVAFSSGYLRTHNSCIGTIATHNNVSGVRCSHPNLFRTLKH